MSSPASASASPSDAEATPTASLSATAAQLRMATFRLARRLRGQHALDDISGAQFAVLTSLKIHGPHTLGDLAEREHVTAPSMNRTVNCLAERGLLRRDPDADDRRKVWIALTDDGTRVVVETEQLRNAWLEERLTELSTDELALVAEATALIRKVADR